MTADADARDPYDAAAHQRVLDGLAAILALLQETQERLEGPRESLRTLQATVTGQMLDAAQEAAARESLEALRVQFTTIRKTSTDEVLRILDPILSELRTAAAYRERHARIAHIASAQSGVAPLGSVPDSSARILSAPGTTLMRIAEFCFSRRTCTGVLEPVVADMQHEYFEALAAGRERKAKMVLARGYAAFVAAVIANTVVGRIVRGALALRGSAVGEHNREE